jgi:hypothetical protein
MQVRLTLLRCCLFLIGFSISPCLADSLSYIELTRSSAPAPQQWNSNAIAVCGFRLGITKDEMFSIAKKHGLQTSDRSTQALAGVTNRCDSDVCTVEDEHRRYIGLDLHFDNNGKVDRLTISTSLDGTPDILNANISRQFRGELRKFFLDYSDELRLRLFGREDQTRERKDGPYRYVDYEYSREGIRLHAGFYRNDSKPFELSMAFLRSR